MGSSSRIGGQTCAATPKSAAPCPRVGKLIGSCKFSPRFDLGAASYPDGNVNTSAAAMFSIMETTRAKTYVADVCERCGKTIEREKGGA